MAERSILEKYDEAIINWLVADFASIYPTLDVQVLFATPDTQYAEFTTKRFVDQTMLKVPRIALYRGDHRNDPKRHNRNRIARFRPTPDNRGYEQAWFPAPINIPYQIGLWTDKVHQMNRWQEKIEWQFRSGYRIPYFKVVVGDGWAEKVVPMFWEGSVNNSDLEPDPGRPRLVRRDYSMRLEAWIFQQPSVEANQVAPIISEIEITVCEMTTKELLDRQYLPR